MRERNREIEECADKGLSIEKLCEMVHELEMNIRICVNVTNYAFTDSFPFRLQRALGPYQPIHDETGCHSRRDHIGQRVQVGPNGRMRLEQPCGKAVEEVEETCHENHDSRLDGHAAGDEEDGHATRDEVAASEGVGDVMLE